MRAFGTKFLLVNLAALTLVGCGSYHRPSAVAVNGFDVDCQNANLMIRYWEQLKTKDRDIFSVPDETIDIQIERTRLRCLRNS
jgi:hypothetical protein